MAFLKLTKEDVETFKPTSNGVPISKTGIYPITIKWVEVDTKEIDGKEIPSLNIRYQRDDNQAEAYLFNIRIKMNNGNDHFQLELVKNLMYLFKLKELKDPISRKVQLKDSDKQVKVLPEFDNKKVKVFAVAEYNLYNGNIYKKIVPYQFYDYETNATAFELSAKDESKYGFRYSLDEKKLEPYLRDGVTMEQVEEYEKQFEPKPIPIIYETKTEDISLENESEDIPF